MPYSKYAILIAGPTASGKSALALRLARDLDGVVINADSMQVYADLAVITARPSADELTSAPHRLYGVLDAQAQCSAADWSAMAMAEVASAWDAQKVPILVGGTGLYLKYLLAGMANIPAIDEAVRTQVRAEMARKGAAHQHALLQQQDPTSAARIDVGDSQRIARALEVVLSTGRTLSDWHKDEAEGPLSALYDKGRVVTTVLDIPREALYARCEQRFDQMMGMGALDEVRALMARNLDPQLPIMKSLGVPQLRAHLNGDMTLEAAVEDAKMQTRRFAKRQLTWFRNQFLHWNRLNAQYSESEYQIYLQNISK